MEPLLSIPTVTHVIQQALTPVFLLGGVGAILNVLTGRLGRIVDRYRNLTETADAPHARYDRELATLGVRTSLIQWAIAMSTVCAFFVCLSIITLFVSAELGIALSRVISVQFILAILAQTAGLSCFLREIYLATADIQKQPAG